ncbi:alpha/beta-hydrolase [Cyathus striatus]|nr:alpha/beta-hydrolase [Cyathus striatus]
MATNGILIMSSDGTQIFASAVGNPRNPPIVFVHGYTLSAAVFDDLFKEQQLNSRYYLLSYDLRGHGRSGKPNTTEAYASNLFADDFAAVIKYFKVKSPLYVGWSYGGTVPADIFANLLPQTISGIFAVAAIPTAKSSLTGTTPFTLSIAPSFGVSDDVAVDVNTRTTFIDACFNNASNIPIQTRWSMLGSSVSQLPPISVILLQRAQDPTKLYEAGAQGFPYLSISGTNDKIVLNDNVTQSLQPHFTNLEVIKVNGGSHTLFIDNTDKFIQALIPFANKVLKRN